MSNLSIFDKKWLDVVFDGKNKEYGAYQLRQETQKTSLRAFAFGTMIVLSCIGIFTLSSFFSADSVATNDPIVIPIKLTGIKLPDDEVVIPEVEIEKVKSEKVFSDSKELVNPIITTVTNVIDAIVDNKDNGKTSNNVEPGTSISSTVINPTDGNTTVVTPIKIPNNKIVDRKALDEQPSFPGGIQKFYNYVGTNFEKPELNEETTITVKVSFIVEKDGSMSNIKVLEDPGYGLGQEAIRVLKSLKTDWNPGILDGEPVRTFYNLPITVKLE